MLASVIPLSRRRRARAHAPSRHLHRRLNSRLLLRSRPAPPTGWAVHRSRLHSRTQAQRVTHLASTDAGSEDVAEPSLLLEQGKVADDEDVLTPQPVSFASFTTSSCSPAARPSHTITSS